MPSSKSTGEKRKGGRGTSPKAANSAKQHQPKAADATTSDVPPSAGYLISCDIPTKQFIMNMNELKPSDKRFILQDLDATHLLVKHKAKNEIVRKVEEWEDSNVFSAVERVGEDFDTS